MIPQEFIGGLLQKADIGTIITERVEIVPIGAQLRGRYPFCNSNQVFNVSVDKQIYKCFKCNRGGNFIKFIQEIERTSFPNAIRALAAKLDLQMPTGEA